MNISSDAGAQNASCCKTTNFAVHACAQASTSSRIRLDRHKCSRSIATCAAAKCKHDKKPTVSILASHNAKAKPVDLSSLYTSHNDKCTSHNETIQHLNGKLRLLPSESGPHIDLHLSGSCLPQQPCQEGIAGRPPQVLAQLTK